MNNTNYLSSNRATLQISGLEDVNFNITGFNLPDVTVDAVEVPTRFNPGKEANNRVTFSDLTVEFLVDEDLQNWISVFDWMTELGMPKEHNYRGFKQRFSDATLIIYSSHNNPIVKFKFVEVFPNNLSGINFTEKDSETVMISATATFSVLYYEVIK